MHYATLNMTPKIQTYIENIKKNVFLQIPNDVDKSEALFVVDDVVVVFFSTNARQPKAAVSPAQ